MMKQLKGTTQSHSVSRISWLFGLGYLGFLNGAAIFVWGVGGCRFVDEFVQFGVFKFVCVCVWFACWFG